MNKKGEVNVGTMIIVAMGVIVALALLGAMFADVGQGTNIYTATDTQVVTAAAANGTVSLTGRENTTAVTIETNAGVNVAGNFTILTEDSNGDLDIVLRTDDLAVTNGLNGSTVNVTYSYKPDGYVDSDGGRAFLRLVLLFAALAIAAFALIAVKLRK